MPGKYQHGGPAGITLHGGSSILTGSDSNSVQLGQSACSFSSHGWRETSMMLSGVTNTSGAAFRFALLRVAGVGVCSADLGLGGAAMDAVSLSSSYVRAGFRALVERRVVGMELSLASRPGRSVTTMQASGVISTSMAEEWYVVLVGDGGRLSCCVLAKSC